MNLIITYLMADSIVILKVANNWLILYEIGLNLVLKLLND